MQKNHMHETHLAFFSALDIILNYGFFNRLCIYLLERKMNWLLIILRPIGKL